MEPLSFSDEGGHVRARIERTASGKLVKMLTTDEQALVMEVAATVDKVIAGFRYFENRVARDIEDSDIPAIPRPTEADIETFEPK